MERYQRKSITYNESNFIICHLGGGVSITAHRKGRMIDSNDNLLTMVPMTLIGPVQYQAKKIVTLHLVVTTHAEELEDLIVRNSRLSSHLGTADVQEV